MTAEITSLIREYGFPELSNSSQQPQKEELDAVLAGCFERREDEKPRVVQIEWNRVFPEDRHYDGRFIGKSHTRDVYVSKPLASSTRWVAKIDTADVRNKKAAKHFPHGEEIAYKISKLFHWNTVPKTKIIHQNASDSFGKYKRYTPLKQRFRHTHSFLGPITFTFQHFKEGQTLPNRGEYRKKEKIQFQLASYQKAFLLGWILGKGDARGDNTIWNPKTGEVFEIDNEEIGYVGFPYDGVLNDFEDLKKEALVREVMETLLKVDPKQLLEIQEKYMKRDTQLVKLWQNEPTRSFSYFDENTIQRRWAAIRENFTLLQTALANHQKRGDKATLLSLEEEVAIIKEESKLNPLEREREKKNREKLAKEAEAQARLEQEPLRSKEAAPELTSSLS